MLQSPDALIFDCDGTLVDTMPGHFRAWTEALGRYGLVLPEPRFYALGGVPTRDIIALLSREAGVQVDIKEVAALKEALTEHHLATPAPIAEVVAIAAAARGVLPMAVATGSLRALADRALRAIAIRDWFSALVAAEDVTRPKPAPDTYLRAAELLKVDPRRCRAFEDTDLGLESARAAGMDAIDIRHLRSLAG
ncbi:MAG: HAD-IA family hydrolase [Myxococcales bacterium]|nr:HAD-IA family hydrolase [Myxococcales bacterium]